GVSTTRRASLPCSGCCSTASTCANRRGRDHDGRTQTPLSCGSGGIAGGMRNQLRPLAPVDAEHGRAERTADSPGRRRAGTAIGHPCAGTLPLYHDLAVAARAPPGLAAAAEHGSAPVPRRGHGRGGRSLQPPALPRRLPLSQRADAAAGREIPAQPLSRRMAGLLPAPRPERPAAAPGALSGCTARARRGIFCSELCGCHWIVGASVAIMAGNAEGAAV